ncbi:hypothetical protein THASP1DRAFT_29589 [Thamnocephalis sphaerospora]|uniref:TPPC8 C-terminal Ig-like domain-containing protein n=1 Tax=Thamnocephalis sphaerospora TaxID=78915 RepID=A0A4P9XRB7_9FUNG|nr:hypothetical protein THASP1DRAFT_29589 [Thamnocephalis sphaerospora]|eukprot:RKP08623.1 hypothetical protein THASP1DRAFT_29589 [Thamnocephalis sphaerospora]
MRPPVLDVATSRIAFEDRGTRFAVEPVAPFFSSSRRQWRRTSLSATYGAVFDRFPNVFTLFASHEIDLAVFWRTPQQDHQGHHHVLGVSLSGSSGRDSEAGMSTSTGSLSRRSSVISKRRSMSMLSVRTSATTKRHSVMSVASRMALVVEDPIKMLVQSPSEVEHDFKADGICLVDMAIAIKNCAVGTVEYTLDLDEADEAFAQRPEVGAPITKSDASASRFDWIGITHLTGTLRSNEERTVYVQACFSQSGVYNLNRWRMSVVVLTPVPSLSQDGPAIVTDRATFSETPAMPHFVTIANKAA